MPEHKLNYQSPLTAEPVARFRLAYVPAASIGLVLVSNGALIVLLDLTDGEPRFFLAAAVCPLVNLVLSVLIFFAALAAGTSSAGPWLRFVLIVAILSPLVAIFVDWSVVL